jgi:signal transduction histidine kinase
VTDAPNSEQIVRCWEFAAQFAGRLAHDLSNIFTGVAGYSELALLQLPADHPATPFLKNGMRSTQRGIDLAQRLHQLRMSGISSQSTTSVGVAASLAMNRLGQSVPPGVKIEVAVEAGLPIVAVASELLLNVICELLRNAVEACGSDGSVKMAASVVDLSSEQAAQLIGHASAGRHVELRIGDSGPGLPPSHRLGGFAFPMTTTKAGHWGLGLAIVFRGLYAGRSGIALESSPEHGTLARVLLPVAE